MRMADLASKPSPRGRLTWPQAVIGLGLGLTVVWTCVLAYGVIRLIDYVI